MVMMRGWLLLWREGNGDGGDDYGSVMVKFLSGKGGGWTFLELSVVQLDGVLFFYELVHGVMDISGAIDDGVMC